jgi:hypothetical protein
MPGRMGAGRPCRCAAPASAWMGLLSPVWATKAATSSSEKRLVVEKTAPGSRGAAGAAAVAEPLAAPSAAPASPLQLDPAFVALPRHPPGPASSRHSCNAALWLLIGTAFQAGRRPRASAWQPNIQNDSTLRSVEARAVQMAHKLQLRPGPVSRAVETWKNNHGIGHCHARCLASPAHLATSHPRRCRVGRSAIGLAALSPAFAMTEVSLPAC